MAWEVLLHEDVSAWFLDLADVDPETAALVEAAIDKLADDGPMLGRPRSSIGSRALDTTT